MILYHDVCAFICFTCASIETILKSLYYVRVVWKAATPCFSTILYEKSEISTNFPSQGEAAS